MELTLVWKRNPFKSRRKSIEKAQNFIDETCVEKMTEFVPVAKPIYRNAGQLRDSVEIKEPGLIIYTAPFAKHDYYNTEVSHKRSCNPKATSLWFETMKSKYKAEILQGAQQILTGR